MSFTNLHRPQRRAGFTLLEIASMLLVVGILATLCMPLIGDFRARTESLKCRSNLAALGLGMNSYLEDHRSWPQIESAKTGDSLGASPLSSQAQVQAEQWIAALQGYGIAETVWHCPTVQKRIDRDGEKNAATKKRIDYLPTRFDMRPESPKQWPKHPWFVERGSLHPTGPNILFADGTVMSLSELAKNPQ